jgi:hypothetical protein
MPAPALPRNPSLDELRTQIVFSLLALSLDDLTKVHAATFEALRDHHPTVVLGQHATWDAQTLAGLKIRQVDRRLDGHVESFVEALVGAYGGRDAEGVQHYLRGRSVSEIKRTVLGPEVTIVAQWIASIAKETSKKLRAWGPIFEADLADAEAVTKASAAADVANRLFREKGPLAEHTAALERARDELHNKLDALRIAQKGALPADWVSGFFLAPRRAAKNEAERKARADARAAKKLEAERKTAARAEALQKLREARAALKALAKK